MGGPRCGCGCGVLLVSRGTRGPDPTYASAACRTRAYRLRRIVAGVDGLRAAGVGVGGPVVEVSRAPASKQVAAALMEVRAAAAAFHRLARIAPPMLASRCRRLGDAIEDAAVDAFGPGALG